ncbi:hypothetical protein FRX31_011525 [Thalictrum thalictroides]|uniref:Uncharacterized protein n=1 Tax=Thalictrum thalictroides TaxID=46969 RepID=A0A7J6WQZ5_THATH|nr:hypothetical protein FRX31_011525 [Thalictrum thalictroides]
MIRQSNPKHPSEHMKSDCQPKCIPTEGERVFRVFNTRTVTLLESVNVVVDDTTVSDSSSLTGTQNSGVLDPVLPVSTSPVSSPVQVGLDTSDSVSVNDDAELVYIESPNDYFPTICDASIPATSSPSHSTTVDLFDKASV